MDKDKRKKIDMPKTPDEAFSEAERYYNNGKNLLKKSRIEYGIYKDSKYVKEASAMGYLAGLRAIDGYLISTGMDPSKLPTSLKGYEAALQKIPQNGKLMAGITVIYQNLHILGYYRGGVEVEMIKSGFSHAKLLIDTLKKAIKKAQPCEKK